MPTVVNVIHLIGDRYKREMFDKEQLSEAWTEWKKQRAERKY